MKKATSLLPLAVMVIGALISGFATALPPAPCTAQHTHVCAIGCERIEGALINCCNTASGGCCDRMCRPITCVGQNCSSGTNYAAGTLRPTEDCSAESRCEP